MRKSRFIPLSILVFLLLAGGIARAQVVTDAAVLQKASQEKTLQEKDLRVRLLSLARQKGWALILHNKKGRSAYLTRVDGKGNPVYTTTTDNIISAATIGTSQLWPGGGTGLGLSGSSANMKGKLAVWDEGEVRPTHVELVGRVVQVDGSPVLSDHSTHVSGTLIAAGVNPNAKGMAFGMQQLQAYDFNNDEAEMMAAAGSSTDPILVSSHSYADIAGWYQNGDANNRWEFWGNPGDTVDYKFGYYSPDAQIWDSIAYHAPNYLIVKASGNNRGETGPAVGQPYYRFNSSNVMSPAGNRPAGLSSNDGYDIIATYGCAKNILTLGAVNPIPGGYSQPSDVVLADFSSWGPTGDGRIKPDLVADGVNVLSSISTADNAYDIYSGTSMATPASAGSSFLLQEYYSRLHAGAFMRSATLKGLLIHTADEAGPNPGPDYQYGWGLIDMVKAASVITSDTGAARAQMILEKTLVNTSDDADTVYVVASGKTPLTATISWTDPPAVPINNLTANFNDTSIKLINDLDLRVIDTAAGSVIYKPWILNPAIRPAAATTGDNIRDNVEKVEVGAATIAGKAYRITVSHKGVLARGSQAYSLLISGAGGSIYCGSGGGGAGTRIDSVTLVNLHNVNSAGCKSYSDFTGLAPAQLQLGQTVIAYVGSSVCDASTATREITAYIDYNNDGIFEPGEMIWQRGGPTSGSGVIGASFTIPTNVTIGTITRMRIIAEETTNPASVSPCGMYGSGETQDYMVQFTATANDVGVSRLEYPTLTTCASDSQLVAVRIHNYGTTTQTSVPVSTTVLYNGFLVTSLNAVCKDSIAPGSDVVFTYPTTFATVAGDTYTFVSQTSLTGDPNPANDTNTTTLTVSAAASALSGTAAICTGTAALKANATGDDLPLWYLTQTGGAPIASGNSTTTTVIPANHTYYLGVNDLTAKEGPASKLALSGGNGAYFGFSGNYISFTSSQPLTIESAKMYIGNPGKISFTLATLGTSSSTGYTYFPLYNTTIDVGATVSTPAPGQQNVTGDNGDQGANFYLNIPVPVPGTYILIMDCLDNSTAFVNVNSSSLPYPFSIPGVISITGNNLSDGVKADSASFPKEVYFPFYNMGIRLSGCPGPRVAVVATTPTPPTITLNGNVFTSSAATGNQWFRSGNLLPGAVNQTDTAIYSGVYETTVSDASGCSLISNSINFVSTAVVDVNGASIGLVVSPNPNPGVFQLQFTMTDLDDLSIRLINTLGQDVYLASYPGFVGQFSQQIQAGNLAAGMYVLKIQHGSKTYVKKILVKR